MLSLINGTYTMCNINILTPTTKPIFVNYISFYNRLRRGMIRQLQLTNGG